MAKGIGYNNMYKISYLDLSDNSPQAWRHIASTAVPLFSVSGMDIYAFPPLLNSSKRNSAYVVMCVKSAARPDGPALLVRAKVLSSSTKIAAVPPNSAGSASGLVGEMAGWDWLATAFIRLFTMCGCRTVGPPGGHMNNDGPAFVLYSEDPDDQGRQETLSIQTFQNEVSEGKAGRTIHEQIILDGLKYVRDNICRGKMIPHDPNATRAPGELFAVAVDEIQREMDSLAMKPMLAQDGRDIENLVEIVRKRKITSVFLQPKLDGIRVLSSIHGDDVAMITRQGTVHPIVREFRAELMPILQTLEQTYGSGVILDGELYIHQAPAGMFEAISMADKDWKIANAAGSLTPNIGTLMPMQLNKIMGAAGSYGKGSVAECRNRPLAAVLEYHIFTCVLPSKSGSALERYHALSEIVPIADFAKSRFVDIDGRWVHHGPRVQLVPARVLSWSDLNTLSSELEDSMSGVLNAGYEGIMVYASSGMYEPGKRTWNLMKLKATETEWFEIVGVEPERGLPLANLRYRYRDSVYVASGFFSDAVKSIFYNHPTRVTGKWALIRYQKITQETRAGGQGALRDPKIIYLSNEIGGPPIDFEA